MANMATRQQQARGRKHRLDERLRLPVECVLPQPGRQPDQNSSR
jgi:hypothetical protein